MGTMSVSLPEQLIDLQKVSKGFHSIFNPFIMQKDFNMAYYCV
jgi:hypothetical protein